MSPGPGAASASPVKEWLGRWGLPILALLLLAGVPLLLIFWGTRLAASGIGADIKLPLLAIGGVVTLLTSLAALAVAFASLKLTDPSQALALPEGSVRAVIALCLVVLFGVISITLYASLSESPIRTVRGLTDGQLEAFKRDTVGIELLSADRDSAQTPPTATVYYRTRQTKAAEDFAKQLLVLVGTLVTSVAGFYFGSKAAAPQGAAAATPAPTITAVSPATLPRGTDQPLEIAGSNLLGITAVTLAQGPLTVAASDVRSNETRISCRVNIPQVGKWDVLASDTQGRQARLGAALDVT